jgi:hypothetical protein
MLCPCGRRSQEVVCGRGGSQLGGAALAKQLECDEACAKALRNRRLAVAFGRVQEEAPDYSSLLVGLAQSSPRLVAKVEEVFDMLVNTWSPTPTVMDGNGNTTLLLGLTAAKPTQYTFPATNRTQRKLVHQLAAYVVRALCGGGSGGGGGGGGGSGGEGGGGGGGTTSLVVEVVAVVLVVERPSRSSEGGGDTSFERGEEREREVK